MRLQDQAERALYLVDADPGRAIPLARDTARQARRTGDLAVSSVAERALGLALARLKDPDAALRHLREAVRLGRRAGSAELAAEAGMRLAFALNVRGRSREALREIEAALVDLTGVARGRAIAQRAVILGQLGRLEEALPDFRAALAVLRRADDHVWMQRVLSNRGVAFGYLHEFAAAEADLKEAAQLCTMLELDLSLGFVQQNLGWVTGMRGDVPAALHYLDLAEQCFRAHGAPVGELLTDRCQLLLSVRLISEARRDAEAAVAEFAQHRPNLMLPEARLMLAQAAILDGDPRCGLQQAGRALREFGSQGRPRWAALARFTVLQARLGTGPPGGGPPGDGARDLPWARPGTGVAQFARSADELAESGWPESALEARLLAAKLALRNGWAGRASAQLAQLPQRSLRGPALERARAFYGRAILRQATGNRRGALAAARTALRVLDDHRTGLGATDLRAHASGHRVEVAELGLRLAFETGRPAQVLDWAEQGRASHLMLRPVRAPANAGLSAALSELRAVRREIFKLRIAGGNPSQHERRQVKLEQQIRDHVRRLPGDRTAEAVAAVPARTLAGVVGDAALVEFVHLDATFYAAVVAGGRIRLRLLGSSAPVQALIEWARFALHRLARYNSPDASRAAAQTLLADTAKRLDAILFEPIARDIAGRPLIIVPTGPLQSLPWSILPSCAKRPVTVAPSAALWHAAQHADGAGGTTVLAAGPGLPGADAEVEAASAIHGVAPLHGAAATVDAVTAALDGATLAHLAAHGRIHPTNPLFSSLTLADGPLTVYDLNGLRRSPRLVILAACEVGRSAVRPGDELLGLSAAFLALGTVCVIASVVPIPDAETTPLMTAFHQALADGQPAAHALTDARQQVADTGPLTAAAAAGFVSIGADFTLRR